jgi:hypothetical protein
MELEAAQRELKRLLLGRGSVLCADFSKATERHPLTPRQVADLARGLAPVVISWAPGGAMHTTQAQRHEGRLIAEEFTKEGTHRRIVRTGVRRKLERLVATLSRSERAAASVLTEAYPGLREYPDLLEHSPSVEGALFRDIRAVLRRAESLKGEEQPRGAPPNRERLLFVRAIRREMERVGLRPTSSQDGVFSGLISLCYQAAGYRPPVDRFRLIKAAMSSSARNRRK